MAPVAASEAALVIEAQASGKLGAGGAASVAVDGPLSSQECAEAYKARLRVLFWDRELQRRNAAAMLWRIASEDSRLPVPFERVISLSSMADELGEDATCTSESEGSVGFSPRHSPMARVYRAPISTGMGPAVVEEPGCPGPCAVEQATHHFFSDSYSEAERHAHVAGLISLLRGEGSNPASLLPIGPADISSGPQGVMTQGGGAPLTLAGPALAQLPLNPSCMDSGMATSNILLQGITAVAGAAAGPGPGVCGGPGDEGDQFLAAQVVASLAAADARMASSLVSAGAIPALVQLGREASCEDSAQAAAFALANLAAAGFGVQLVEAGAPALFATLLRHGGRCSRCAGTYGLACLLVDGHLNSKQLAEAAPLLEMVARVGDGCAAALAENALERLHAMQHPQLQGAHQHA